MLKIYLLISKRVKCRHYKNLNFKRFSELIWIDNCHLNLTYRSNTTCERSLSAIRCVKKSATLDIDGRAIFNKLLCIESDTTNTIDNVLERFSPNNKNWNNLGLKVVIQYIFINKNQNPTRIRISAILIYRAKVLPLNIFSSSYAIVYVKKFWIM